MTHIPGASFFDVDETLVTGKSLFGFLRFHLAVRGRPASDFTDALAWIGGLRDRGVPREEANRAYFTLYADVPEQELAEQGRAWFTERYRRGGFFHPPVLAALRRHQEYGEPVVLVSGSFFPCLDPIAGHLGVDAVLATRPVIVRGVLTGAVERPMIGAAKALAAELWAARNGVSPADCHAYGDHSSDLPLLELVGHPVAVGQDRALNAHIESVGGLRLPGAVATGRETVD